jgi:hypothetical protein
MKHNIYYGTFNLALVFQVQPVHTNYLSWKMFNLDILPPPNFSPLSNPRALLSLGITRRTIKSLRFAPISPAATKAFRISRNV